MSNTTPYMDHCPIGCGTAFETTTLELAEGALQRCKHCLQLLSQCSEQQYWDSMQEFDTATGTMPDGSSLKRSFEVHQRQCQRLQKHLDIPVNQTDLLDIGCSSGAFLRSAAKLGYRVHGVEPAPKAVEAAEAAGFDVRQGTVQDVHYQSEQFDIVTLFEVIEHLKDPASVLCEAWRILKLGGIMAIRTGNTASWTVQKQQALWEYFQLDNHGGHISFFNPSSMHTLAKRCGFNVLSIKTRAVKFSEKDQVARWQYRLYKIGSELLNLPAAWLNRGHEMFVILQKPS